MTEQELAYLEALAESLRDRPAGSYFLLGNDGQLMDVTETISALITLNEWANSHGR